jgi:UDP-N-acetylmuramoylalanine--D-glutamate ligase
VTCKVTDVREGFPVSGRHVVVVGAARSGIAAARLLAARGARVVLTEMRSEIDDAATLRAAGIELELAGHRPETLRRADLIVLSPGVSPWQPLLHEARAAGIPIIGELELASRWFEGRVIAITGTKGKSTTTTLVGRMLEAGGIRTLVGGNLGPAASLQVAETAPDVIHVLEASSFQLEVTETFHADIAVFLNFSADHLDRHRSVEEYAAAKARIFMNQRAGDLAFVNADDPGVLELARAGAAERVPFSVGSPLERGVTIREGVIVRRDGPVERTLLPVSSVRLLGRHLLADVVAAAGVADACGVGAVAMTQAVESFKGLEHALELVTTIRGIRFVNDSKATNVDSARRALEAFDTGVVPIMGGRFKGGDIATLIAPLRTRARAVVVMGESRERFRDVLGAHVDVIEVDSLREAVRVAWRLAPPQGTVLLAPACASFDMFRDYAERGQVFKDEVMRLQEERAT